MNTVKNEQEILDAFRENLDIMTILTIIRDFDLKNSWLAAGSVEISSGIYCQTNRLLTVKRMWM